MPNFPKMTTDPFGQMVFNEQDLVDMVMTGIDLTAVNTMLVDSTVDLGMSAVILDTVPQFVHYNQQAQPTSIDEFDRKNQSHWFMPDTYKQLDIAEYVLSLCVTDAELQRCGQELLLYQQKNLFDLLRYLKYLVDLMTQHQLIWGVGRGSSTASFVLYKLGVHKIDSLYYDLDVQEFLR